MTNDTIETDFDKVAPAREPETSFQRLVPDEGLIDRVPDDMGEEAPDVTDAYAGDVPANPSGMDATFNIEVGFDGL